jgi:uncharacterized protein (TIGR02145 family)
MYLKKLLVCVFFGGGVLVVTSCLNSNNGAGLITTQVDSAQVVDIDGNIYTPIKIGHQTWLKENLKTTRFRNGDSIRHLVQPSQWAETVEPAYSFYNDDTNLIHDYGLLYNWYVVNDPRGVCPAGWRMPADSDWTELSMTFGGPTEAGAALKEAGFNHWIQMGVSATNVSGFSGLPGGHRTEEGAYERLQTYAFFWSADHYDGTACAEGQICAHECSLQGETSYFLQDWGFKKRGMSVRCIKEQ